MSPSATNQAEPDRTEPRSVEEGEDGPLQAPHPFDVAMAWLMPAAGGALVLGLVEASLLARCLGVLALFGLGAAGWALLASRPSDFETIVAVARGHRVKALKARRIWAPLNAQWRRPRQYRVTARDSAGQIRTLQVAFPLLGRGPVLVRLSLESAPEPLR